MSTHDTLLLAFAAGALAGYGFDDLLLWLASIGLR